MSSTSHSYNFINNIDQARQSQALLVMKHHLFTVPSPQLKTDLRIQINFIIHLNQHLQGPMREVYLLLPLLTTSNSIESEVERVMNINAQQYQLHEIGEDLFAVQLHHNQLGYAQLQEILNEYQQQRAKISILEGTLMNYDWNQRQPSIQASSIDSLMKKAMKYKEVKEENKKLKKLLQNQLENTQKVREETQKTMKVLREEFDTLVRQMSKQNNQKEKIKLHTYKVLEKQENFDGRISNKF